jgi:hypothetical protein
VIEISKPHFVLLTLDLIERILEDLNAKSQIEVMKKYNLKLSTIVDLLENAELHNFQIRRRKAMKALLEIAPLQIV